MRTRAKQSRKVNGRRERCGALLSIELMLVLPVVIILLLAIVEFSMLWSANQLVKTASHAGCRVATLPAVSLEETEAAAERAVTVALAKRPLINAYRLRLESGQFAGDAVCCEVRLPMAAAAPNLLAVFGFDLDGRELVARSVMRKE